MIPAHQALQALKDGNRRFLSGARSRSALDHQKMRGMLVQGQAPSAVILSCSDSRVPPELVFDQDLGDLFVIRVAGNIVEPSQIASAEYAVGVLGTRLIVVMGHSGCGAIQVTLQAIEDPAFRPSVHMEAIINRVETAIRMEPAFDRARTRDQKQRIARRANIMHSVERLRTLSEPLSGLIRSGEVLCIGAEYSVDTGVVSWL